MKGIVSSRIENKSDRGRQDSRYGFRISSTYSPAHLSFFIVPASRGKRPHHSVLFVGFLPFIRVRVPEISLPRSCLLKELCEHFKM